MADKLTYFNDKTGKDVYAPEGYAYDASNRLITRDGGNGSYDQLAANTPSTTDFINKSSQPVNEAQASYIKAMQMRANPMDIYSKFEEAMGIPQQRKAAGSLREQVYGLEDAIKGVKGQVAGTTRESMVTEAQRQRLVQRTQEPLLENLGTIGTSLGRVESAITSAEQTLATKVGLAMQGQAQDLEPFKAQLDYLQNQQAMQITGFTSDKQTNLDIALSKIRRGEQLSDQEREESFQLLRDESNYTRELNKMKKQSDINMQEWLKQSKTTLSNSKEMAQLQSGLNKDEAKYQQGLDIDKSFKQYRAPSGGGSKGLDVTPGLFALRNTPTNSDWTDSTPQSKAGLTPPPMSAPPGADVENPPGSGLIWTMGSDGKWK